MNPVFVEFIIRNLEDENPKNLKCQRERELIMQMIKESLAAISKKANNNVVNMKLINYTFSLLQTKK